MKSLIFELLYYLEKNLGKVLVLLGILFLVIGLLFLSILPSIISILGFFLGMVFTFTGILVHTESITHNISRAEKIGSILIVISIVLFASSFAFFLHRDVGRIAIIVPFGLKKEGEAGPRIFELRILEFKYPLIYLSKWLFIAGLTSLIAGVTIKRY